MKIENKFDILLKNLKIIDGSSAPAFYGDIGIKRGIISAIGRINSKSADNIVDCADLIASPGFIDIHNHSDLSIFIAPGAENYLFQGVTTIVSGNCGYSAYPSIDYRIDKDVKKIITTWNSFKEYYNDIDKLDKKINTAFLIGHNNLRNKIIGSENLKATDDDIKNMQKLLGEGMECGAFGMSTGLIYRPGSFADINEIIELAKIISKYDGIYASHIRNESDSLIDALIEAITIGRKTNTRVQISHYKSSMKRNHGYAQDGLNLMEYYRRRGVEVTCDVYPETSFSMGLRYYLPPFTRNISEYKLNDLLKDKKKRKKIEREISLFSETWENELLDSGHENNIISIHNKYPEFVGKSIKEISKLLKMTESQTVVHLVKEDNQCCMVAKGMCENDVRLILKNRLSMVSSDNLATPINRGMPHPRGYRAFTKVLCKYARDERLLTLEEAIYKMTYFPAWKLGLKDRGLIKENFIADLAIFDYNNVKYTSMYGDSHHYSEGMKYVIVNGKFVILEGKLTKNNPGELIKKNK